MKYFKIIQFKKNGRTNIEAIPEDWEIPDALGSKQGKTHWPKTGLKTKIMDANSKLELTNVEITKSKVKRDKLASYAEACAELDRMAAQSDTDLDESATTPNTNAELFDLACINVPPTIIQESLYQMPAAPQNTCATSAHFIDLANSGFGSGGALDCDVPSVQWSDQFTQPVNVNSVELETLTAYFQEIMEKMATVLSGIKQTVEKVEQLSDDIQLLKITKHNVPTDYVEPPVTFACISTEDALKILENELRDATVTAHFKSFYKQIVGSKRPKEEAGKCLHEILNKLFEKSFWLLCSWKGGSHEKNVKKFALFKYETTLRVIVEIIREVANENFSELNLQKAFESKMKNRHALSCQRKSAPKNRPKGLHYKRPSDRPKDDVVRDLNDNVI